MSISLTQMFNSMGGFAKGIVCHAARHVAVLAHDHDLEVVLPAYGADADAQVRA